MRKKEIAELEGSLDAIMAACTAMLALHPCKDTVLEFLKNLESKHCQEQSDDTPETKLYIRGIIDGISRISSFEKLDLTQSIIH